MNRRVRTISISGILVMALTVFLFFMITHERIIITWLGFTFILLAEIILFGGLLLIEIYAPKASQIVWRVGGVISVAAYSVISIIISLIYMGMSFTHYNSFIILQAILFVIAAIAVLVFLSVGKSISEKDDKVSEAMSEMNVIIDKVDLLRKDPKNSEYSQLLNKVYEDLKYSDTSTRVPSDSELELQVVQLELELLRDFENKSDFIAGMIQDILLVINKRKAEIKNSKVGGF